MDFRVLDSGTPEERAAALCRIAEDRLAVPLEQVHRALDDPDDEVRIAAAFALAKVGDSSSLSPLHAAWRAVRPDHSHMRRQLLIAIGDIGGASALAPVLHDFALWTPELREIALDFLSVRPDAEAARPLLEGLLETALDAGTRARVIAELRRQSGA